MHWLILLATASAFVALGKFLKPTDEIHAIAVYSAGLLSAFWGLAMAPGEVLLGLGMLAFGWLQISAPRA